MSLSPADGAAYWLRWQVLVCGALIALPAAAAAALLPRLRRNAAPLRAPDLWVPCWARLHPGWLLGYRAFALAAAVALLGAPSPWPRHLRLLLLHPVDLSLCVCLLSVCNSHISSWMLGVLKEILQESC
ncbi:hypothetical protein HU200_050734 [Digitaria exilis]|uniref:Uncharacterized protein n=1 Tax=Digitaria exilis TaxID=1010633 RepID=A0A835AU44_9POAL|nr:hypothetical protein HU200_050734 [Digitaria exilis]